MENTNVCGHLHSYSASTYPINPKYLKVARGLTQDYIEEYGATFREIDKLDIMIAMTIEKIIKETVEYSVDMILRSIMRGS